MLAPTTAFTSGQSAARPQVDTSGLWRRCSHPPDRPSAGFWRLVRDLLHQPTAVPNCRIWVQFGQSPHQPCHQPGRLLPLPRHHMAWRRLITRAGARSLDADIGGLAQPSCHSQGLGRSALSACWGLVGFFWLGFVPLGFYPRPLSATAGTDGCNIRLGMVFVAPARQGLIRPDH